MGPEFDVRQLADLAEACLRLSLFDEAQVLLDAAYDKANNYPVQEIDHIVVKLRSAYLDAGRGAQLTVRQKKLLRLAGALKIL